MGKIQNQRKNLDEQQRQMERRVIAIACADIHLSMTPPPARSKEPNWFAAMKRPLTELWTLSLRHKVPVLCAGDVFDKPKPPPELINFALKNLPSLVAIPGQHDLPFHSHEELNKSAYRTLAYAGKIISCPTGDRNMWLEGFGWGEEIEPASKGNKFNIAMVHRYHWIDGTGYKDAPITGRMPVGKGHRMVFPGYDVVIIGDNHKPWDISHTSVDGRTTTVFNCGSLMRRKSDDTHKPRVGLVMSDGTVETHFLDTSNDVFTPVTPEVEAKYLADNFTMDFVSDLRNISTSIPDFEAEVVRVMDENNVSDKLRRIVLGAMGHE